MLKEIRPNIPTIFLNTGFHFRETLEFAREISTRWGLGLIELTGRHGSRQAQDELYGPRLFETNPDKCCVINKVEPLYRELENYDGWIAGIRRDQSAARSAARLFHVQVLPSKKAITKIHPLVECTRREVDEYVRLHNIPVHPLIEQGYGSIGCWPCTETNDGRDDRSGRWPRTDKVECGMHDLQHPAEKPINDDSHHKSWL